LPDDVYFEVPFSEMDTTGEDSVNPYPETKHVVRYKHTSMHTYAHLLLLSSSSSSSSSNFSLLSFGCEIFPYPGMQ